MRRTLLYAAAAVAVLAATVTAWRLTSTHAAQEQPVEKGPVKAAAPPLPITQVVLFNSGVGYFQREGQIDGDGRVELSFAAAEINDLLKSLILEDKGGKVSSVNYDSHDPIEKILHSFALDLNNNPTYGQILNQARGEKIELLRGKKDAQPAKLTGTIVGMQAQHVPAILGGFADVESLNLLGPRGLQSIPLDEVQAVRFLNPVLQSEFQRALKVLASSHDTQKKTVSLGFSGAGKRPVRVGYVVERPIWKTSYRLVLERNGKLFVQGWALVENTSDDDWNNVRMVLVSGRPISYKMNLYEPLFIPRPTVEPELFASLRPPVYDSAMLPQAQGGPAPGMGFPGMGMPGMGAGLPGAPPLPGQFQPGLHFGQLPPGGQASQQRLTYEELQRRRAEQQQAKEDAKKVGGKIAGLNLKEGIASIATAEEVGDYYQYILDQKITLPRQKSAMLPILNQHVEGNKVSIYNTSVHTRYPLLGLRLKNTSGQPLTQGPITVYEDGSYAGDTRILDLQAGEERLLSYALDLGTEIKPEHKTNLGPHMTLRIDSATLTANFKVRETTTYQIKNRSPHERVVILEHPLRGDWNLITPAKLPERSRDVYRFQVVVPSGQLVKYDVVEEQGRVEPFTLTPFTQPPYAIAAGVAIKQILKASPEEVLAVKIVKGVLQVRYRERESRTYFIQNNSTEDRTFQIDHIVRTGWKRLDGKGGEQVGPAVYRFQLEVAAGKTGHREVLEERTFLERNRSLWNASAMEVRELLAHPLPSAKVKEALTKTLELRRKLLDTKKELAERKDQLKILSEDQARVRENLKIIPTTTEPYKDFLKKFVAQETEIEALQRQIRQLEASLQKQEQTAEASLNDLSAE